MAMIDSVEYDAMAKDLLAGRGFVDHVGFVRPPLYPGFLALCYAIGGMVALQFAQVIIGAVTAPLVGLLGAALFRRSDVATSAAVAAAVYPWFFQWVGGVASETLFTAVTVASLVLVTVAAGTHSARLGLLAGLAFGAATLTRTNVLVLVPALALWSWRVADWRVAASIVIGLAALLVPHTAYNVAAGNGLVFGSSGGGMNFYIGNNPDTDRFYGGSLSDEEWRDLSARSVLGEAALAQAGCPPDRGTTGCTEHLVPSQRDAFWYRAGWLHISTHTGDWVRTELAKFLHYWRPWVDPRAYSLPVVLVSGASFAILLVLAFLGLRAMPAASRWLVILVAVAGTVAAVGWQVQLRYRYAFLDPVLLAAAGGPLSVAARRAAARLLAVRPPTMRRSDPA